MHGAIVQWSSALFIQKNVKYYLTKTRTAWLVNSINFNFYVKIININFTVNIARGVLSREGLNLWYHTWDV